MTFCKLACYICMIHRTFHILRKSCPCIRSMVFRQRGTCSHNRTFRMQPFRRYLCRKLALSRSDSHTLVRCMGSTWRISCKCFFHPCWCTSLEGSREKEVSRWLHRRHHRTLVLDSMSSCKTSLLRFLRNQLVAILVRMVGSMEGCHSVQLGPQPSLERMVWWWCMALDPCRCMASHTLCIRSLSWRMGIRNLA